VEHHSDLQGGVVEVDEVNYVYPVTMDTCHMIIIILLSIGYNY